MEFRVLHLWYEPDWTARLVGCEEDLHTTLECGAAAAQALDGIWGGGENRGGENRGYGGVEVGVVELMATDETRERERERETGECSMRWQ